MLIMANYAPHPLPPLATDPSTDLSEVRFSKVSKWASKENKSEKSTMLKYQYGNTITKTYLYNFDPLKPHFHFSKTGFQGYALFFLFLLKTIDSAYSLEPPRRGGSNEYPQSIFWAEIRKISEFLSENFQFFDGENFNIFNRRVYVMPFMVATHS